MDELRRGAGLAALADAAATWRVTGRRPPLGLRAALRRQDSRPSWIQVPEWLNADWLRPLRMEERLRALDPPDLRLPRANARYRMSSARWTAGFEFGDASYTGVPVDCRYPFMDERVVAFALRLPPLPWCADKALLRRALAPVLPEVARRPKVLLAGEPLLVWASQKPGWTRGLRRDAAVLEGRVDAKAWTRAWGTPGTPGEDGIRLWRLARVSALARWLEVTNPACAALDAVA
jgi:hypothetical protein